MPLPRKGYRWRWARTDAPDWSTEGSPPTQGSWVAVPTAHAAKDSDHIVVEAGAVRAKTPQELAAETQQRTRREALAAAIDTELQLLGLESLKTRLAAAGKATTKIQTRINILTARLNTAVGKLP